MSEIGCQAVRFSLPYFMDGWDDEWVNIVGVILSHST